MLKQKRKKEAQKLKLFAERLEALGNGKHPKIPLLGKYAVKLPSNWLSSSKDLDEFIQEIFPNISAENMDAFTEHAILTTTNIEAEKINGKIMELLSDEDGQTLLSHDSNMPENKQALYDVRKLNKLTPSMLHHMSSKSRRMR